MGLDDILSSITGGDSFGGGMSAADLLSNAYGGGGDSLLPGETGGTPDQLSNEWTKLLGQDAAPPDSIIGTDIPSQDTSGGGGVTGIGWLDGILHGMGQNFQDHPLDTIKGALGIIAAIDRMRSGNNAPGQAQMSGLIQSHLAGQAPAGGAAAAAMQKPFGFTGAQLLSIPQVKPTYSGPLTNTFYNGKR